MNGPLGNVSTEMIKKKKITHKIPAQMFACISLSFLRIAKITNLNKKSKEEAQIHRNTSKELHIHVIQKNKKYFFFKLISCYHWLSSISTWCHNFNKNRYYLRNFIHDCYAIRLLRMKKSYKFDR